MALITAAAARPLGSRKMVQYGLRIREAFGSKLQGILNAILELRNKQTSPTPSVMIKLYFAISMLYMVLENFELVCYIFYCFKTLKYDIYIFCTKFTLLLKDEGHFYPLSLLIEKLGGSKSRYLTWGGFKARILSQLS